MQANFPFGVRRQQASFQLVGSSASAGFGLSGAATTAASNSGHWILSASFVISNEDTFLAWQGFIAEMRGVLGTTLVPCVSRYLPFDAQGRRMAGCGAVSLSGNSLWDTSGFAQTDIIHARLNQAASLRDAIIEIENVDTLGVRPGHFIGIGDSLHRVVSSHRKSDTVDVVQISPVLRQDYPLNERVIMDRPRCKMRFADPKQGVIDQVMSPIQSITVNFVEAI